METVEPMCDGQLRIVEGRELQSGKASQRKTCERQVRFRLDSDKVESSRLYAQSSDKIDFRQLVEYADEGVYRTVVENSPDGICIVQNGELKFYNSRLSEFLGSSFDELKGDGFLDFIHPEDRSMLPEFHLKRSKGEKASNRRRVRAIRKDGAELVFEIDSSVVAWDGAPATLIFVRDSTLQKKMEDSVRRTNKLESIGALSGGIAHDFNNLLASIIGYAELAMDEIQEGSTIDRNLREIYKAGIRAKELVKQILTYARQGDREIQTVRVREIAEEALELLRSSIPSTIEIRTDIESDSRVKGDPTQIHQIFMNLCTNASQAMENEGGILKVELKDAALNRDFTDKFEDLPPGDYLELSVSDTGPGIPSDIVGSVFEPYFTTRAPGEGSGMGLAIVRSIAKKYGGETTVFSEEGKGAEFTVFLPVESKGSGEKVRQAEAIPGGSEKILLIDCEPAVAKMQRETLEKLGYRVTTRTNGLEAIELFKAAPYGFDLVVADTTMPKMTGDRLGKALMEIRPDIPVVLQTGFDKRISRESAIEMGFAALAYKPLIKKELAETVRSALDKTNAA